jgi:two-component system, NtrC family, C4-dicarboxylate transport sensor histidine kinase DctB
MPTPPQASDATDFTRAIPIAEEIFWVGMYLPNDPFQCHAYFIENGDESVLVDPGSMLEFDAIVRKVSSLAPLSNIKYIILHHQDPDLCASVPALERLIARDDLRVVTHSRMPPLIKHYGIRSRYYEIDKEGLTLRTRNGLTLDFLTTPYCHSPGAFVSYEPRAKVLFSSDIFGGIEESWEFYAGEDYFEKAKQFHAEYMPSKDIFNYALGKMERLDLELIAPQHGSIIKKPYIPGLFEKMKDLDCGLYIEQKYNQELIDTIRALRAKDEAIKEREQMLFQHSKMAEMGEMIGNIAHQWRQPLAIANTLIAIIKEKNEYGMLDKEELAEKLEKMENSIAFMSNTIEDFMTFFRPNKEPGEFSIRKAVTKALEVLFPHLRKEDIAIDVEGDHNLVIDGFINEYIQVVIAILSNAKEVFAERHTAAPAVHIRFYKEQEQVLLEIADNAGGIKEEHLDRIFDPYFTTKHKSVGTGLGLYIAKMIIERSMNGSLTVCNTEAGATFTIGVPFAHRQS